jgi:D-amino peptidase
MKIIIMTDMEGVAGVTNASDYIGPDCRYYEEACRLTSLEVSAAVEGALEAGATEVLVIDGHGHGAIRRELLHPKALLMTGRPWVGGTTSFTWGVDGSFAAAMSIGQHAKANSDGGHICHTGSFPVEDMSINGLSVGELGWWMLLCGSFGIPVVMVSGDGACCDEARALIPNIETAAVKWGFPRGSASGLTGAENQVFNCVATHLSPDEARARIREHAYRSVKRIPEICPFTMEPPYALTMGIRSSASGGKPGFATVKSTDILDIILVQRGKAIAEAKSMADELVEEPKKKKVRKAKKDKKGKKAKKKERKAPVSKAEPAKKAVKKSTKKTPAKKVVTKKAIKKKAIKRAAAKKAAVKKATVKKAAVKKAAVKKAAVKKAATTTTRAKKAARPKVAAKKAAAKTVKKAAKVAPVKRAAKKTTKKAVRKKTVRR